MHPRPRVAAQPLVCGPTAPASKDRDALLGPLDWIFIFGSTHQRLGDMIAGTVVIEA
jgi:hypothetical protein